ncbi:Putative peptidase M43, pregnancy-associated plasma-A [Septoria linicola]|uniref:Peptidase M43, pregnancy-associated plasma-A n=1 Tax=Septoria linicola TaxID=215465 RepID=A0A9Q9AWQ0_9PEZI|nr:putative peptidase M43, pregnancy-associated plasma-A [Septoria linicola]USW53337.1 Putative peptidase M43, pregnancy-associated plasma-A [Septoria linicola]
MLSSLFALVAAAGLASADLIRCGTSEPNATHKAEMNEAFFAADISRVVAQAVSVNTYVHIVTTSAKSGRYTRAQAEEQMRVMNDAYSSFGISFNTQAIDITVNNAWAAAGQGSSAERQMKQNLRQGSYADLNLYFLSDLGGGLLGFCYFPLARPTSSDRILDGCINLAGSLPGGDATNYDEGYTAVHESGHWFGLYHVFQGQSCTGSGDQVSDTPIQRNATRGCPASQDSCPNAAGVDSINNYMDFE